MSCPICNNTSGWPIPFSMHGVPEILRERDASSSYRWLLCTTCGNGYPSVQPDIELLSKAWEASRNEGPSDFNPDAPIWVQRRLDAQVHARRSFGMFAPLAGKSDPGSFLDIACGMGETVRMFQQHGWRAEGIDADPNMQRLHQHIGITSHIGQIERVALSRPYDVIHIAHAIYFITEPMRFLRTVRTHLKPDGLFCIVISNLLASYASSQPSYVHSFYPTDSSLRFALASAGLQTVASRYAAGSIYIAAKPAEVTRSSVNVRYIYWKYRTQAVRLALIGRPYLKIRRMLKKLLRR